MGPNRHGKAKRALLWHGPAHAIARVRRPSAVAKIDRSNISVIGQISLRYLREKLKRLRPAGAVSI